MTEKKSVTAGRTVSTGMSWSVGSKDGAHAVSESRNETVSYTIEEVPAERLSEMAHQLIRVLENGGWRHGEIIAWPRMTAGEMKIQLIMSCREDELEGLLKQGHYAVEGSHLDMRQTLAFGLETPLKECVAVSQPEPETRRRSQRGSGDEGQE